MYCKLRFDMCYKITSYNNKDKPIKEIIVMLVTDFFLLCKEWLSLKMMGDRINFLV